MHSILRELTAEKHKIAERKNFNIKMFKGELDKQSYLVYLEQQLAIFTELENNPLPHVNLNRKEHLLADIAELQAAGYTLKGLLNATKHYQNYLSTLSGTQQLPHIYLHYLAVLYGGQMMKRKVPSQGKFYEFEEKEVCIASIRALQKDDWVEEVNKGYDAVIDIFDELEKECILSNNKSIYA